MEKSKQDVEELVQGIKSILKENRCSLSVEEELTLTQTISYLEKSKDSSDGIKWEYCSKALELLLKIFLNDDLNRFF